MTSWGDLNARARGLGTHLLSRSQLQELVSASDLATLSDHFAHAGLPPGDPVRGAAASLELTVRRDAALHLTTLARWAGRRTDTLAVIFEDEDRRSLRAVVRGALQGAPKDARVTALIPTPSLPERALETLAGRSTVADVAAVLVGWDNPYGHAILDDARQRDPDLLLLETLLNRTFAARALAASRRERALRAHVRRAIDLENVRAALGLATRSDDVSPDFCFLEGGDLLSRSAYLGAATAGTPRLAAQRLAEALRGTAYGDVLAQHTPRTALLEGALLGAQLSEVERMRRLDPTSPAPLLAYALRLRAQAFDLQTIIWGIALGAPRPSLASGLAALP